MRERAIKTSRVALRLFGLSVAVLAGLSCRSLPDVPRTAFRGAAAPGAAIPAPSWLFHPLAKSKTLDRLTLATGTLEVASSGTRSIEILGRDSQVSPFGAPEPLTAVLRDHSRYAFLGQSGTVYFSLEPLAPFVEVRTPDESFTVSRRSRGSLLAVSRGGGIFRSTDLGLRWEVVEASAYFFDLAADDNGTVLALAAPESWYQSRDGGATFLRAEIPTIAARALMRSPEGALQADGLYGRYEFHSGELKLLPHPVGPGAPLATSPERGRLPRFARASEVQLGRASLVDADYAVLNSGVAPQPWTLEGGRLDQPTRTFVVSGLDKCGNFRFVGGLDTAVVLCALEDEDKQIAPALGLFVKSAGNAAFVQVEAPFRGALKSTDLAQGPRGELAISGLCPSQTPEKGCSSSGVALRAEGKWSRLHFPGLANPETVVFDQAGGLWVGGRRSKDRHYLVFGPSRSGGASPSFVDLHRTAGFPIASSDAGRGSFVLLPGEGGALAAVLEQGGVGYSAIFDPQGELEDAGRSPPGAPKISGSGRLLAAVSESEGRFYESSTGGLSWQRVELPREICPGRAHGPPRACKIPLACSEAGCLVGDELTRVGWGRSPAVAQAVLTARAAEAERGGPLPGYACRPTGDDWRVLPGLVSTPSARDVALGNAAWAQVSAFPEQAAATALHVPWGSAEIQLRPLLAPVVGGDALVLHVSEQVEGSAAIRFPAPSRARRTTHLPVGLGGVEVGWDNRVEGVTGYARLGGPVAGKPSNPFDVLGRESPLMSVAGRGIYIQLAQADSKSPRYFIEGSGASAIVHVVGAARFPKEPESLGGWIWEPDMRATLREEWLQVEGEHVAVMMLAGGRVLVRSGPDFSGQKPGPYVTPFLLGVPSGDADELVEGVSLGYQGTRVGFFKLQFDAKTGDERGLFVGLGKDRAFLDAVAVPLQAQLPSTIRPCTEADRRDTPRVVAPKFLGRSRSVVVDLGAGVTVHLQSEAAVLFGTRASPCVVAFEAESISSAGPGDAQYMMLVFPDPAQPSWIFRETASSLGRATVSTRPLVCESKTAPIQ